MPESVPIRVLSDRRASPDGGEHFHNYVADRVYSGGTVPPMSADLAAEALREGWGERCDGAEDSQVHAPAREAPAGPGPDASCLWCGAAYARRATGGKPYARRATGGQPQKFCSSACRRACHTAARRWAVREIEAGRLSVANVLGRG